MNPPMTPSPRRQCPATPRSSPPRATMKELGRLLGLDKSSTSGLVDRAEARGLVSRARSQSDRRAVLVNLSDDGRSLVAEVAARFETEIDAVLDRLKPRDREGLSRLVSRLLVAHAADHGIDLFAGINVH